jgi:hypothetical protein
VQGAIAGERRSVLREGEEDGFEVLTSAAAQLRMA